MSNTVEIQHSAYSGPEIVAGSYAAGERTPLLNPILRSSAANESPIECMQNVQEQMPTLPLLLDQFGILLKSSIPVFGTQILEYALLITSILAAGHLGKLELAACSLGSMTANVTAFCIIIGMAGALDTVLPGVWGASTASTQLNHDSQKAQPKREIADSWLLGLWCQRMAVIYLLLLVPMLCIWLNAETILLSLRQDKEVARLAGRYLARLAFGLPAYSLTTITKRYFQTQGLFSLPTKIGMVVAGTNALITVVLVYYPDPLPRSLAPYLHLGFDGAAISTAISYNLVAVASVVCGRRIEAARSKRRQELEAHFQRTSSSRDLALEFSTSTLQDPSSSSTAVNSRGSSRDASPTNRLEQTFAENSEEHETRSAWHPLSTRAFHPTGIATLLYLGLGGVGQTATEWWAWELIGLASAVLGPTSLAAQSVLIVSSTVTFQVPSALGIATSVRIGQLLGLVQPRLAKLTCHSAMLLAFAISLVFTTILWVWRKQWAYLFSNDEDVVLMVASILPVVALFQVFDGNAAITGGILRARGKQGTGALISLSAYYVIGIPLGLYLAFKDVGFPDSLPDHPLVNSLVNRLSVMLSPSSPASSFALSSHNSELATIVDDPRFPSLPEATAGLRGLWIGLTVSLIYCSVFGSILCLMTDWEHEVERVRARVRAEDRRGLRDDRCEDANDGATLVET